MYRNSGFKSCLCVTSRRMLSTAAAVWCPIRLLWSLHHLKSIASFTWVFVCVCVHVFCVKLFDGFCVDLSQSFDVVWLHSSTRHTTTSSTSSSFFGLEPSSCNLFAFSSLRLAFAAVVNVRPIVRSQKLATDCTFSHAILAFYHGQACVSLPLAVKSCSFEIWSHLPKLCSSFALSANWGVSLAYFIFFAPRLS